MIVIIAAWLYIADAVLILGSLLLSPWGFNGVAGLVSLALAGLLGAMGIGLLKRLPWARWLSLGSSLLGWTLGSVFLLLVVGYLFAAAPLAMLLSTLLGSGIFSFFGVLLLLVLLMWIAGIVISFKLFWYLCSEEGCAAFGVPHGSTRTVLASCGAWVGIFIVNSLATGGGQAMSGFMGSGAETAQHDTEPETEAEAAARREAQAYAERRQRAEAMLREQAELEAAMAAGEVDEAESEDAPSGETEPETAENYTIDESPVPVLETAAEPEEEAEERSATRILKCVDASGGTIFTQGYCPPGSKLVRSNP